MWRIEFVSDRFLPFLPEERQGNPGIYGFELASWLAQALAGQGVITSYPVMEDWGWVIEYIEGEIALTIGCASVAAEGDGYLGRELRWRIFIEPHVPLILRVKGVTAQVQVERVAEGIRMVLERGGLHALGTGQ